MTGEQISTPVSLVLCITKRNDACEHHTSSAISLIDPSQCCHITVCTTWYGWRPTWRRRSSNHLRESLHKVQRKDQN